jgi:hypothetical protein
LFLPFSTNFMGDAPSSVRRSIRSFNVLDHGRKLTRLAALRGVKDAFLRGLHLAAEKPLAERTEYRNICKNTGGTT